MRYLYILGAALVAAATPAHAAGGSSFSGPWAGAVAAYDRLSAKEDGADASKDGIAYGVGLGYDFDLGGVFPGIEAELSDSTVKASLEDVLVKGDGLDANAGRDLYIGLRLGVPVGENLLVYAKGGYSNMRFTTTYTKGAVVERDAANQGGFRAGAGAEVILSRPFVRLEYRYSNYGSFEDNGIKADRHQVAVSAGMRF